MSIEEHVPPFLARIREDPFLASDTFEGVVPPLPGSARRQKYATLFAASPSHSQGSFTGPRSRESYTFTTHSVGITPAQAQRVSDHLAAQLLDHVLVVEGRSCRRLSHPVGRPVEEDTDVTPSVFYIVDQWDLISDPA